MIFRPETPQSEMIPYEWPEARRRSVPDCHDRRFLRGKKADKALANKRRRNAAAPNRIKWVALSF